MDKRKAKKLLFTVQEKYIQAIKCFERADHFGRYGQTTKALNKRDEGMDKIRKAEAAIAELETLIDE